MTNSRFPAGRDTSGVPRIENWSSKIGHWQLRHPHDKGELRLSPVGASRHCPRAILSIPSPHEVGRGPGRGVRSIRRWQCQDAPERTGAERTDLRDPQDESILYYRNITMQTALQKSCAARAPRKISAGSAPTLAR